MSKVLDDLKLAELTTTYLYNSGESGDFNNDPEKFHRFITEVDELYSVYDPPLVEAMFKDLELAGGSLSELHDELMMLNHSSQEKLTQSPKTYTVELSFADNVQDSEREHFLSFLEKETTARGYDFNLEVK